MPAQQPSGSRNRSWRKSKFDQAPHSRKTKLGLLLLTFVSLMAMFVWYFWPVNVPRLQVVVIPVEYEPLNAPSNINAPGDSNGFEEAVSLIADNVDEKTIKVDKLILDSKTEAREMNELGSTINSLALGERDALVLFISAHGVSYDGTAYLLGSDLDYRVDPAELGSGRVTVKSVLSQVSSVKAGTKVVLIDAGRITYDPRLGVIVNEFPKLLEQEVKALDDPDLWVICSHTMFQKSHVYRTDGRSVFGFFAAEGLKGEANLSIGDESWVTLDEYANFLYDQVTEWANTYDVQQTPILFNTSGGGIPATRLAPVPVLAAAPAEEETPKDPEPAAEETEKKTTRSRPQPEDLNARIPRTVFASFEPAPVQDEKKKADGAEQEKSKDGQDPDSKSDPTKKKAEAVEKTGPGDDPSTDGTAPDPSQDPVTSTLTPLERAWILRDKWERRDPASGRQYVRAQHGSPVDFAPHVWREYVKTLLYYEHKVRLDKSRGTTGSNREIEDLFLSLEPVTRNEEPVASQFQQDAAFKTRLYRAIPRVPSDANEPMALGATGAFGWVGSQSAIGLEQLFYHATQLDRLLVREDTAGLGSWVTAVTGDGLAETELAGQVGVRDLGGSALQSVLEARLLVESIAADYGLTPNLVKESLTTELELKRQAAEQRMILGSGRDQDQSAARQELANIITQLKPVRDAQIQLANAISVRNDLVFRSEYYVHWLSENPVKQTADELTVLLANLKNLSDRIENDLIKGESRVRSYRGLLNDDLDITSLNEPFSEQTVNKHLQILASEDEIEASKIKSHSLLEALLEYPLLTADQRRRILSSLRNDPLKVLPKQDTGKIIRSSPELDRAVTSRIEQLVGVLKAQLGLAPESYAGNADLTEQLATSIAGKSQDDVIEYVRALGKELESFYRTQPQSHNGEVSANTDFRENGNSHYGALLKQIRYLYLVDGRDAIEISEFEENGGAIEHVRRAQLFEMLNSQWPRFLDLAGSDGVVARNALWLVQAAQKYYQQADSTARIPRQPAVTEPNYPKGIRVKFTVPTRVELTGDDPIDKKLIVAPEGTLDSAQRVAMMFWSDHPKLNVSCRAFPTARSIDELENVESFNLSNSPQDVFINVGVKQGSSSDTRQVGNIRALLKVGNRYFIETIPVHLPTVDIVIAPIQGDLRDGKTLMVFANKDSTFKVSLVNRTAGDRKVTVKIFAKPNTEPLFDQAGRMIQNANLLSTVPDVSLEPSQEVELKFPMFEATAEMPGESLKNGIVFLVDDGEQKVIKEFAVEVWHPRRFMTPEVRLGNNGQVTMNFGQMRAVPPGGCDIGLNMPLYDRDLINNATGPRSRKIPEKLDPDGGVAAMVWALPEGRQADVRFALDIDGYPRAFLYTLDPTRIGPYQPLDDVREIRVLSPLDKTSFRPPEAKVPVRIEVDAPLGSDPIVRVGLDTDRDEVLSAKDQGQPIVLNSDRQIAITRSKMTAEGFLVINSVVQDHALEDLGSAGLVNSKAGVLATLTVNGQVAKSASRTPVTIHFDKAPPTIRSLPTLKGTVKVDMEVPLLIEVTDVLSSIKSVQAFIDTINRNGEQDEGEDVITAVPASGENQYLARLKVEKLIPRKYEVYVFAVDAVGNESRKVLASLTMVPDPSMSTDVTGTPKKTKKTKKKVPPSIVGTLKVGAKIVGGAPVVLKDKDGKKLRETSSNAQGVYKFAELDPGEYIVEVPRGIYAGKFRQGKSAVIKVTEGVTPARVDF